MAEALICSSCNQKIEEGEYVNLDPKFFHIAHFVCKACSIINFAYSNKNNKLKKMRSSEARIILKKTKNFIVKKITKSFLV